MYYSLWSQEWCCAISALHCQYFMQFLGSSKNPLGCGHSKSPGSTPQSSLQDLPSQSLSPQQTFNEFITCFSRILNLRKSFTKFYVSFFRGLQSVFFCYDKHRHFLSQSENFNLVEKQTKENFVKFFRRFRNCENMWWAWPRMGCKLSIDLGSMIWKVDMGFPDRTWCETASTSISYCSPCKRLSNMYSVFVMSVISVHDLGCLDWGSGRYLKKKNNK